MPISWDRELSVFQVTAPQSTYIPNLEYHSVCPLVGIVTPTPSPTRECVLPPLEPKGGQHLLAREGVGGTNSDDWNESLAHCQLCAPKV